MARRTQSIAGLLLLLVSIFAIGKILAFIILCVTSAALGEDFKTLNGKEYKNVTISRVEPDGIILRTKSAISKVYFVELPKEVQERFHYEPAKAAESNAAEQAAIAQLNDAVGNNPNGQKNYDAEAEREWEARKEKLKQWLDDQPVTPPQLQGGLFTPSYADTVEFINAKLKPYGKIWFGEKAQKMILQEPGVIVVFDPSKCDPRIKYGMKWDRYCIQFETSGGGDELLLIGTWQDSYQKKSNSFVFQTNTDSSDSERIAKAFRHLIEMFGGTPGNF